MYQLVRQNGSIKDATFEIELLDPGVEVFSFGQPMQSRCVARRTSDHL
jgi:hypothetical protein